MKDAFTALAEAIALFGYMQDDKVIDKHFQS
jgi:hypothetical protein